MFVPFTPIGFVFALLIFIIAWNNKDINPRANYSSKRVNQFSIKQHKKFMNNFDAVVKLYMSGEASNTVYNMKHFYLLNIEKFDFDFSEDELDEFLYLLGGFYYDKGKRKVIKIA